ncbi:MAG: PIN domain-containing protein [Fibromonadaceae bacterium]|jgi:PIN domain nuclease of toxin-antitoxin system|nr:PIN domain-containing protein [Fibromonadaceae bacterium]
MEKIYILDACALIAYLTDEPGSDIVAEYLRNNSRVAMHKLNLLEVYYGFYAEQGKECADNILRDVKKLKIEIIDNFSDEMFLQAGRLKASYRISLADSMLLAQAMVLNAAILSSDHHELDEIEELEQIKFLWIR